MVSVEVDHDLAAHDHEDALVLGGVLVVDYLVWGEDLLLYLAHQVLLELLREHLQSLHVLDVFQVGRLQGLIHQVGGQVIQQVEALDGL